jgi:hypothetical protein
MRNRSVQTKIISKCKMPPRRSAHDYEPAPGSDLDLNAVTGAIFPDRVHECTLVIKHGKPVDLSQKCTQLIASKPRICASKLRPCSAIGLDLSSTFRGQ